MAVWYKVQNATINEGVQNPGAGMRDRRQAPSRHGPNGIPPQRPKTQCGTAKAHTRAGKKRKKEKKDSDINARGSRLAERRDKIPTDLRDNAAMVSRDNLEWHTRPAPAPYPTGTIRFARFVRIPQPDVIIRRSNSDSSRHIISNQRITAE